MKSIGVVLVDIKDYEMNEAKFEGTLDLIAVEVSNSKHGDFLKLVSLAWQKAHPSSKYLMEAFWCNIIDAHGLEEEFKEAIAIHLKEYLPEHLKKDNIA